MEHVAAGSRSERSKCEASNGQSALQSAEHQCRRIVHKYAIAAGGLSVLPVPSVGVMFNEHALEALSRKILAIFELSGHQMSRQANERASKVSGVGKMTHMAIKSKRVKGSLISLMSRYGSMSMVRFAPGVGAVIVLITSIAVIEYFGHRLIDDCLMAARSRDA